MKLNTLVFLPSKDSSAVILRRTLKKRVGKNLSDDGQITTLKCELDSFDGYYLFVKVLHPLPGCPKCVAKVAIPHAAVLMVVQSDWKTPLGFSSGD